MARDILRVDGVSPEIKAALKASAERLCGTSNASLLVRSLIAEHLKKGVSVAERPSIADGDSVRVELRLQRAAVECLDRLAEEHLSPTRNYYLVSIILAHLGQPQLQGDEIEVLRRSNYELAKVGTNLNQVAKAFNQLVQMGGGKFPEIGRKIAALRKDVRYHTHLVLRVLNAGTKEWEKRGRGQRRTPRKR